MKDGQVCVSSQKRNIWDLDIDFKNKNQAIFFVKNINFFSLNDQLLLTFPSSREISS